MYKFQVVSDLHLEFGKPIELTPRAKYLLLCGDIGYPEQDSYKEFLKSCSKKFEWVFYVAGNHEYYQSWKRDIQKIKTMNEIEQEISYIVKNVGHNIHFLNNSYYDLYDLSVTDEPLRIVGSTLWSHLEPNVPKINDTNQIYNYKLKNIGYEEINHLHRKAVEFIEGQLVSSKKLLVMTHHLPTEQLVLPKYKNNIYNSHFYTNLEHLIKDPIVAWCCGHSHGYNECKINSVELYLNGYGYPTENRNGSNLDFTFDVITI